MLAYNVRATMHPLPPVVRPSPGRRRSTPLIEIPVSDPNVAIATALITGCTTVIVTTIRAAARVTIAWIENRHPHGQHPSPREIEPPDP